MNADYEKGSMSNIRELADDAHEFKIDIASERGRMHYRHMLAERASAVNNQRPTTNSNYDHIVQAKHASCKQNTAGDMHLACTCTTNHLKLSAKSLEAQCQAIDLGDWHWIGLAKYCCLHLVKGFVPGVHGLDNILQDVRRCPFKSMPEDFRDLGYR
jgi:hypothetical protein